MSNTKIANHIEDRLNQIVESWIYSVRSDSRIKSDHHISSVGLEDHIPVMIREMCELISSGKTPDRNTANEARIHAFTRLKQGYRARDVVRELSLLRLQLLNQLQEVTRVDRFLPTSELLEANRIINLYIDEDIRYAVAIYTESQTENGE